MIYHGYWATVNAPPCHLIGARPDPAHQAECTEPWGGPMLSALWLFQCLTFPPRFVHILSEDTHSRPCRDEGERSPAPTPPRSLLPSFTACPSSSLGSAKRWPSQWLVITPSLRVCASFSRESMMRCRSIAGSIFEVYSGMVLARCGSSNRFQYLMGACGSVATQQALTWHEHAWKCSPATSAETPWRFPEQFSRSHRSTILSGLS